MTDGLAYISSPEWTDPAISVAFTGGPRYYVCVSFLRFWPQQGGEHMPCAESVWTEAAHEWVGSLAPSPCRIVWWSGLRLALAIVSLLRPRRLRLLRRKENRSVHTSTSNACIQEAVIGGGAHRCTTWYSVRIISAGGRATLIDKSRSVGHRHLTNPPQIWTTPVTEQCHRSLTVGVRPSITVPTTTLVCRPQPRANRTMS